MKLSIFAGAAIALFSISGIATAADLTYSRPQPQPVVQPIADVTNNWTGFYLGGTVGGVWANKKDARIAASPNYVSWTAPTLGNTSSKADASVTFGGTLGYNYQFGNSVVVGAELDYNWANSDRHTYFGGADVGYYPNPNYAFIPTYGVMAVDGQVRSKLNSYGSLRARLGYLVSPSLLVYGTGGVAMGSVKTTASANAAHMNYDWAGNLDSSTYTDWGSVAGSKTKALWGYTVGAGLEYALNRNWSIKGEYLYTSLGDKKLNAAGTTYLGDAYAVQVNQKNNFSVARIGVNYRF